MGSLYNSLAAYIFILALSGVQCLRCAFQNHISRDSLSVLALAGIALCALSFFAWGMSIALGAVFIISLFVAVINFQYTLFFLSGLRHGSFSGGTAIGCFIALPVIAVCIAGLVYFRPVYFLPENAGATVEKAEISGSFTRGFTGRTGIFEPINGYVSVFKPRDPPDGLPLVLFICDPRSSISDYAPFLALLAAEGYEVRAGEFFARDNRRFEGLFDSRPFRVFYAQAEFLFFPKMFAARAAELEYSAARDAEALITLYGTEAARQGRRVFLASDSNGDVLAAEAKKYAFVAGSGVFTLGPREGFGCIAQTNPLLAFYFKTPRDEKLSVPRLSAARGGFILGEKR